MKKFTKAEMSMCTESELERMKQVLAGMTVVANMRKGKDTALIKWAKRNGVFVRIDRQTPYGNQLDMKDRSRGQAVRLFETYFHNLESVVVGGCCGGSPHPLWRQVLDGTLTGKVLGCWCYPLPCHGDIIAGEVNKAYIPESHDPCQLSLYD